MIYTTVGEKVKPKKSENCRHPKNTSPTKVVQHQGENLLTRCGLQISGPFGVRRDTKQAGMCDPTYATPKHTIQQDQFTTLESS